MTEYGNPGQQKHRWTQAEVEFLRGWYHKRTNVRMAEILDRTVPAVVTKAHRLGLKKSSDLIRIIARDNILKRYAGRVAS
jgi:hypothetical protein